MNKQQYIEQVFNTMGQLRKLLESKKQEAHEDRTGTVMQFFTLKFLQIMPNSTVGDIAEHVKLSKSSATQLIERLVKAGLVERIHDQKDRRLIHLAITPEGKHKIIELKKRFLDKMTKIFSDIPEQDLIELIRIHTKLIETLQKEQTN